MISSICFNSIQVNNVSVLELPSEVLVNICEQLDIEALLQLKAASKELSAIASDKRVWQAVAARQGIWIEKGLEAKDELMKMRQVSYLSRHVPFVLKAARLVGAGRILAILQGKDRHAKFVRNQAMVIECVESVYNEVFALKVVAAKNPDEVYLAYSKLNPILERLGQSKVGRHLTLPAEKCLSDYVRPLIHGSIMGLLREGYDDPEIKICQQPLAECAGKTGASA